MNPSVQDLYLMNYWSKNALSRTCFICISELIAFMKSKCMVNGILSGQYKQYSW